MNSRRLKWLNDNAPLDLWSGTHADGTPSFEILRTDGDGRLPNTVTPDVLGSGFDLASAIDDAIENENARP